MPQTVSALDSGDVAEHGGGLGLAGPEFPAGPPPSPRQGVRRRRIAWPLLQPEDRMPDVRRRRAAVAVESIEELRDGQVRVAAPRIRRILLEDAFPESVWAARPGTQV